MELELDPFWLASGMGLVILIFAVYIYLQNRNQRQIQAVVAAADSLPIFDDCGENL